MHNKTNTKKQKQTAAVAKPGAVLVMSYTHSEFLETCRSNPGAFVLDARTFGKSANPKWASESLKAAIGANRYKLSPELVTANKTKEQFVKDLASMVNKIAAVTESGHSVIITGFSVTLLKVIGSTIALTECSVYSKMEFQNGDKIQFRMKPMSEVELNLAFEKLFAKKSTFEATTPTTIDVNDLF